MTIRDWAQKYIDDGFRPIPIWHPMFGCQCILKDDPEGCFSQCWGKVPIHKNWADMEFSADDFNDRMNIGLAMGKMPNGKWLLGIDNDDNIEHGFLKTLPITMNAITGRGTHNIYEVRPNTALGNWVDIFKQRPKSNNFKIPYEGGVDLRYARGILVAPPSVHKSGKKYGWTMYGNIAMLDPYKVQSLIYHHKRKHPNVKHYALWTLDPSHKNKRP